MDERQADRDHAVRKPADDFVAAKAKAVERLAREKGLLKRGGKSRIVTARLTEDLIAEAKRRTGLDSDSELIRIAVANLALGDDFGEWLIAQRGRLDKTFRSEL